ncbi:reverse transcriptase domain-containing protein [Tanacetum coccineum]|uniref:Reverse transcriptase domain-containing protein n=1 Tax=Tanacetum coccineum TaxID=301880 RepID=A0ABQ4YYG7_9ASTR
MENNEEITYNHPLFLHQTYHPGLVLISKKPTGSDNYSSWKRSIMIALNAKNKMKIITGEFREPNVNSDIMELWERNNDMLISWILNTDSEQIGKNLNYINFVSKLWLKLQERYAQIDGHRIYQLTNDINGRVNGERGQRKREGHTQEEWNKTVGYPVGHPLHGKFQSKYNKPNTPYNQRSNRTVNMVMRQDDNTASTSNQAQTLASMPSYGHVSARMNKFQNQFNQVLLILHNQQGIAHEKKGFGFAYVKETALLYVHKGIKGFMLYCRALVNSYCRRRSKQDIINTVGTMGLKGLETSWNNSTAKVHEGTDEVLEGTAQEYESTAGANLSTAMFMKVLLIHYSRYCSLYQSTARCDQSTAEKIKVPWIKIKYRFTENEQDSLNVAAGGNLLSKTTMEALNIIENKSKVRYSRNKTNASRVNSRENVSKTDERIDKLADQLSTLVEIVSKKVVTPAPVKAVEKNCVTCGGAHAWYNYPATDNNQNVCATTGIYNQQAPPNRVSNQMAPPGFAPVQNQGHKIQIRNESFERAKVDVNAKLPHPTTLKDVEVLLGHAGFYRRLIFRLSSDFSDNENLLEKTHTFVFVLKIVSMLSNLREADEASDLSGPRLEHTLSN